jgi:hypothetical protein
LLLTAESITEARSMSGLWDDNQTAEHHNMCQVHTDQMDRVTKFARIIRDLQQGVEVDLSVESTYSLHDMEFQADLSACPVAHTAIIEELNRRD